MEKVYRFVGWCIVIVAVVVGAARAIAIRWWQVPPNDPELGASIAPSLHGGDWVLLWRLTRPGVGDLVVCPDPDDPAMFVIGRIAGESHDTVVLNGQYVSINDKKPDIEYNCTDKVSHFVNPDSLEEDEMYCDMEDLGDKLHMRGYQAHKGNRRKFKKVVESGKVFLLSDNRAYPFDSRHFGTVDRRTCKETIFFRLTSAKGYFDAKNRLEAIR